MENDKLVRLSDVTVLLRKIEKLYHETYVSNVRADTAAHCIDRIKTIPAVDAVEVVRCRECRYYNTTGCSDGFGWCEDAVVSTGVSDDWYCANGQRREDGDT